MAKAGERTSQTSASGSGGGGAQSRAEGSAAGLEEALQPFREASQRFMQATIAAQESVVKETLDAQLALQEAARQIEREAYDAVLEATKRYQDRVLEQSGGGLDEMFFARAQAQLQYESDVRDIYTNVQTKLVELAQRSTPPQGQGLMQSLADRHQDAYHQYISDLQAALSSSGNLDPQLLRVIAAGILSSLGA